MVVLHNVHHWCSLGKFNVTVTDKVCVHFPDQKSIPSSTRLSGEQSLHVSSNDRLMGLWHVCVRVCVCVCVCMQGLIWGGGGVGVAWLLLFCHRY